MTRDEAIAAPMAPPIIRSGTLAGSIERAELAAEALLALALDGALKNPS